MNRFINYIVMFAVAAIAASCNHVTITTPVKDAAHIETLAQGVESEAELRYIEKLAAEYEQAYRQSYNGAIAMKFKRLVEPILIEAGMRRDEFRTAEEWLTKQEEEIQSMLDILDRAWRLNITTAEQDLAHIAANNTKRDEILRRLEELNLIKEECSARYFNALDTPEAETLRQEFTKVNSDIESAEAEVAAVDVDNLIIVLAYKLQRSERLIPEEEEVVDEFIPDYDTTEFDSSEHEIAQ